MRVHNSVPLKHNIIIPLNPLPHGSEVLPDASPQDMNALCSLVLT